MSEIEKAVALIRSSEKIAIATHVSPDPDAIGSLLGLGKGLRTLGKSVVMLCDDPAPSYLNYLTGTEQILQKLPDGVVPELFIGIDASDPQRLGKTSAALLDGAIPVVNIDHHITNVKFGQVNVVVPEASASAEVVVSILKALRTPLDSDIAASLLTGLVGDTRSFSTSSVTSETLLIAAQLVSAGASIATISELVMNRRSLDVLRIWGVALSNIHADGGILWAAISLSERARIGVRNIGDTGLSSLLLSVPEANIAVLFTEQPDNSVDVSMRARPGFDVSAIAFALGGGGHPLAAGCTMQGSLDSAIARVLELIKASSTKPV